eukprot:Skav230756  [mRNA]  locus=scaffold4515:57438:59318:+ [translate_table: standard]
MELLFMHRLQLLIQLLRQNDLCIRSAILHNWRVAQDDSWLAGIQRSVQWWRQQIGVDSLPSELDQLHLEEAWDALAPRAMSLKKHLTQAKKVHQMHLQVYIELKTATRHQQTSFEALGWRFCRSDAPPADSPLEEWRCAECDLVFQSATALAVHCRHRHARGAAVRRFAVDGACRACGKFFHSRPRLIQHLHSSNTACWITIFRRYRPLSDDQLLQLDETDRQAGHALHQKGPRTMDQDRVWRWCTPEELSQALPLLDMEMVGPVTPAEEQEWLHLGALPPSYRGRSQQVHPERDPDVPHAHRDLQALERHYCQQLGCWTAPTQDVPRPLALNCRYVLLLFSGHRRPHDIACWLWWKTSLHPICVDTAIDRVAGNIFESHVWISLIQSRTVVAAHAAPPCETYSEARGNPVDPSTTGSTPPRPLRSTLSPWGMLDRHLSEVRQCLYGSILMMRAITLLAMVYMTGGCFSLEHPRGPAEGGERWAIWHSAMVKFFLTSPTIRLVTFLQGPLGRPFSKPTTFLCARMRHFAHRVYAAYQPHWRPSQILAGRCGDGWATTAAKEYPSRLCEIIADEFADYASAVCMDKPEEIPASLTSILHTLGQPWDPYLDSEMTKMLSDFQPGLYPS